MTDLEQAKQLFHSDGATFVLIKDGCELARGTRDGIGELLAAVETLGAATRGASLADKIVGKAVALVAAYANIRAVYSSLASEAAQRALAQRQIELTAARIVPLILNKRNDGPCPLERLTLPLDEPQDALRALKEFVRGKDGNTKTD